MSFVHLRLRTEFSLRKVFGKIETVLERAGGEAAAITDNGTWGHVPFYKAAKKAGVKPILGVEVMVVPALLKANKKTGAARQTGPTMAILARNVEGLREMYRVMTLANSADDKDDDHFYYVPRLTYEEMNAVAASDNVYVLSGVGGDMSRMTPNIILEMNPGGNSVWNKQVYNACWKHPETWRAVVCADNLYPNATDRGAYEILAGSRDARTRTTILHIPDEWELRMAIPEATDDMFEFTGELAASISTSLPRAKMVEAAKPDTLENMCKKGAKRKGVSLKDPVYRDRLKRELDLIKEKDFEDYFYVITDMVVRAKAEMFVGPARGSSAGSLVCYLLDITDVDPIVHDLMFERFIDVTRADLPDIDIDFPDDRRARVIEQLTEIYGTRRVGRIGTVLRYKAKSTLGDVAKELGIPPWEMKDLKEAVIDRSTGDARAQFAVTDALEGLDLGKVLLAKYPELRIAGVLEGHAKTSGTHAAGVIVLDEPVTDFCTVGRDGTAQIDKKDAEELNILKIDALGLRTLSVLADCLEQIGKPHSWLREYPLDDEKAFEIFNSERYSGIFQFEGYALQSLTRQMKIRNFDDVAVITALARPGPLHCGAATEFIERRTGRASVEHLHPFTEDITGPTYGTVIYQEQVMAVSRKMGKLSWEDVSNLRKAMSKSLGDEFFNGFWERFEVGANENGIASVEARRVWDKMCTFGSWAFNKSHAISYGLLSYWCAVLKAHYPLEFAAATLRNAKDDEQCVKVLRDLSKEGFRYRPVDKDLSGSTWSVADGVLIGGLTNIRGIGAKTAADILDRRRSGKPLLPGHVKKLFNPKTPYDDIFEGDRRFGDYYRNPKVYKIESGPVTYITDITEVGEYVFIGKLMEKNLRDMNEYHSLVKRGGREIKRDNLFLNLTVEDDTGSIIAKIDRYKYKTLGKPVVETGKIGDWYLFKGKLRDKEWRVLEVTMIRRIGEVEVESA